MEEKIKEQRETEQSTSPQKFYIPLTLSAEEALRTVKAFFGIGKKEVCEINSSPIHKPLKKPSKEKVHLFKLKPGESVEQLAQKHFRLDINSEHGIGHWERVKKIGDYLLQETGADKYVIELFAYLHDSKRENQGTDPKHGDRASLFVQELYDNGLLNISEKQLDQLVFACKNHNDSSVKSNDVTIQTCWDADRLDFWRLGVEPEIWFLNTDFAKSKEAIEFARKLVHNS